MGQEEYDSLNDARIGCKKEFKSTSLEYGILREMVYLGSVIIQASDEFTNTYKARVVEYSSSIEGIEQPYYDGRNPENMETQFEAKSSTVEEFLESWAYARYSTFYGAWGVDTSANPADFATATTLYIHRNSQNGNNMATTLSALTIGDVVTFKKADGDSVEFTLASVASLTSQVYRWTIGSVTENGSFSDTDLCDAYKDSTVATTQNYDDVLEAGNTTDRDAIHSDGANTTTIKPTGIEATSALTSKAVYHDVFCGASGSNYRYFTMSTLGIKTYLAPTTVTDDTYIPNMGQVKAGLLQVETITHTDEANVDSQTLNESYANVACVCIGRGMTTTASFAASAVMFTVEDGFRPNAEYYDQMVNASTGTIYPISVGTDGAVKPSITSMPSGAYRFSIVYPRT